MERGMNNDRQSFRTKGRVWGQKTFSHTNSGVKGGGAGGTLIGIPDDCFVKGRVWETLVSHLASALVISSFLCAFLTAASSFGAFMCGLASFLFFAIIVALVGLIVAIIPAHFGRSRHSVSAIIRVIWHCHI